MKFLFSLVSQAMNLRATTTATKVADKVQLDGWFGSGAHYSDKRFTKKKMCDSFRFVQVLDAQNQ